MPGDRCAALGRRDRGAVRARARAARRLLARGAAARPTTSTATRAAPPARRFGIAAGEMVRGLLEARDLVAARRRRRGAAGRRARRRHRRLPPARGARGPVRAGVLAAHVDERFGLVANLHLALAVSTCPYVEVPFDPPAWSPERRDWLLPAPRRDRPGRDDRAAAGPRARRHPRPRPLEAHGSPDGGPQAACCTRRGRRPASRLTSTRRARARCWCGSRRRASATPTCVSPTATSATVAGRRCSGTRAPARSRPSAPSVGASPRATVWRSASCRRAARAPRAAAGRLNLLRDCGGDARVRAPAGRHDAACACRRPRGAALSFVPASRNARRSGRERGGDPAGVPLWQAALLAARSYGLGAVATRRASSSARASASSAAAGSASRSSPRPGSPAPVVIVAVERDEAKLELARRRGATTPSMRRREPVRAVPRARPAGGSTTR